MINNQSKVKRKSLYINSEDPNKEAIFEGLDWLLQTCNSNNQNKALIAVPRKDDILPPSVISEVIGIQAAKFLVRNKTVKLGNIDIKLLTERESIYSWNGPILAIYPTKKLLDKIDGLRDVTDVLVIPWSMNEVKFWINTWSANELGKPESSVKKFSLSNPVVEEALKSLTMCVNVSTGIIHPQDRSRCIELFKKLKNAGEMFNKEEIRAWLVAEGGWKPEHADDVANVAEAVLEGRRLRSSSGNWRNDIVEEWRRRANKSKG